MLKIEYVAPFITTVTVDETCIGTITFLADTGRAIYSSVSLNDNAAREILKSIANAYNTFHGTVHPNKDTQSDGD